MNFRFVRLIALIAFVSTFGSSLASARPQSLKNADLELTNSKAKIVVHSDGTWSLEETKTITINNEHGRGEMALERIHYDPQTMKVKVKSAFTRWGQSVTKADLTDLADKPLPAPAAGVTNLHELIIPFLDLKPGAIAEYTYKLDIKKPVIPGIFSASFVYGLTEPEIKGELTIISDKPLIYKVRDPHSHLVVGSYKLDGKYQLRIAINKPIYDLPADESQPDLPAELIPRVDVSTAKSWSEIVVPLAKKYEQAVSQPLPPMFKEIVAKARAAKSDFDKINTVTDELANRITYVGDWTSQAKLMYPAGHKAVAEKRTGDCKDFATSTAAILRALGMHASVALVERRQPILAGVSEPVEDHGLVPSTQFFDHALVKVTFADKSVHWVDPTNIVSYSEGIFPDVSDSYALVLDPGTTNVERTTSLDAFPTKYALHRILNVRADQSGEYTDKMSIIGPAATTFREVVHESNKDALDKILWVLLGSDTPKSVLNYDSRTRRGVELDVSANYFLQDVVSKTGGKENSVVIPLPQTWSSLKMAKPDRVSNLYLGFPSESDFVTSVIGTHVSDEIESECLALSPWIDMSRSLTNTKEGFEVHDHVSVKKQVLTAAEISSPEFANLASRIDDCIKKQWVAVSDTPSKGPSLEKATLEDGVRLIETPAAETWMHSNFEAKRIFEKILSINPKNAMAKAWHAQSIANLGMLSRTHYEQPFLEIALKEADEAVTMAPAEIVPRQIRSHLELLSGDIAKANDDFVFAYRKNQTDVETLALGGWIESGKKNYPKAEKWFQAMFEYSKTPQEKSQALSLLALLYQDQGDYKKAVDTWVKEIAQDSHPAWSLNNLSVAYRNLGRWDEAIESAKKAMSSHEFGAARVNLALALAGKAFSKYFKQGDGKQPISPDEKDEPAAEKLLLESLKWDPDCRKALTGISELYASRARRTKSNADLARAKEYLAKLNKLNRAPADYRDSSAN